jgi:hypothetical protein
LDFLLLLFPGIPFTPPVSDIFLFPCVTFSFRSSPCSANSLLHQPLFILSAFACLKGVLFEWSIVIIKEGREITLFRFNSRFQVLVACKNKPLY